MVCEYSLICSSPTFFGCLQNLEGGCYRVSLRAGDCLMMPAQYIHFVLTRGDSVPVGTNFLSMGHLPLIIKKMKEEFFEVSDVERFPGLPDMFALFLYQSVGKLTFNLTEDVQQLMEEIRQLYVEENVKTVSFVIHFIKYNSSWLSTDDKLSLSFLSNCSA